MGERKRNLHYYLSVYCLKYSTKRLSNIFSNFHAYSLFCFAKSLRSTFWVYVQSLWEHWRSMIDDCFAGKAKKYKCKFQISVAEMAGPRFNIQTSGWLRVATGGLQYCNSTVACIIACFARNKFFVNFFTSSLIGHSSIKHPSLQAN